MKKIILLLILLFFACSNEKANENAEVSITKPAAFVFGESRAAIIEKIKPLCDSYSEQVVEPIQLPTAKTSQIQIDCEGFEYAGKKRKVELIFADDVLDIVWILTDSTEETMLVERFTAMYGDPTHRLPEVTFFLNNGTAVRNKPHEVLFISERLKAPYGAFLSQAPQNQGN